jgi:excisionase family DNA binding protein
MKRKTKEPEPESAVGDALSEIMALREVANYLHCHWGTVYQLIQKGEIPAFRVGKNWRFRRADVMKWIAQQRVRPGKTASPKGGQGRLKRKP